MRNRKIIIGSRGSDLALWQAHFVLSELKKLKIDAELKIIKTQGDKIQNLSFDKLEGKGFFTKEIEEALLKKEIDLAVHSHKDLPTEFPKGLIIAAVSDREDPSELLLINKNAVDEKQKFSLKQNALVGTSSARRKSQLLAWRSDLKIEDLRGNVPTRIQKLRDKKYDAILIANAGVSRLEIDLSEFHCEKLDVKEFIAAPAQGVLALQIRESDKELFEKLQPLNHKEVAETIGVERKILNLFDGGCQLPLGVYCEKEENDRFTPNPSPSERGTHIYKVWVAKAENTNSFPKYFYFESRKTEGLAEKIVSKIKTPLSLGRGAGGEVGAGGGLSVFISRDEKRNDFFKRCLQANGFKVFCQSLIEIKQIPIRKYKKCDWVFFSSKNAVKHFFEQKPDVEGVKFGAVGKTTAEEIRKFGKRAEFIGSSDDTRMTGKKFSALLGNKTVLFPQAKESMKTIQFQLPRKENVVNLIVYETIKTVESSKLKVESLDVLVFTSPSNVDAFFEKYNRTNVPSLWEGFGVDSKVVAMGDATANALKKHGVKANKQPASFDDLGLVQAVMSL
ncbi:MAG: hydroxymethylbilane synthase [Bacteroidetes bacterium]|nr:hydroxymethylbilane synthase [Bacteroidota bacterium]